MRLSRDQTIDFKTVFNSEVGQRVMAVLEDKLHYRSSTAGLNPDGSFDDTGTVYREGERNALLFIKKQVSKKLEKVQRQKTEGENK